MDKEGDTDPKIQKVYVDPDLVESGVPAREDWDELLKSEAAFSSALVEESRSGAARAETLQSWWWSVAMILEALATQPGRALPGEMLIRLSRLAHEVAYGRDPEPIKEARRPGALSPYGARRDRAIGGAYIRAVREKRIADRHPKKTIKEAFGLRDDRPAGKWASDEELRREFPIVDQFSEKQLSSEMKKAGARYQKLGPTQGAISARARGDSN